MIKTWKLYVTVEIISDAEHKDLYNSIAWEVDNAVKNSLDRANNNLFISRNRNVWLESKGKDE